MMIRAQRQAIPVSGNWREVAGAVRQAVQGGLSLETAAVQSGVPVPVLHQWLVALEVYGTLDPAAVGEPLWPRLDEDAAAEMLYALRHLPLDARSPAVRYILEHRLSPVAVDGLVQAIKDCRRLRPPDSFTDAPGDALAFRKWRQAQAAGDPAQRQQYLQEGLELAETQTARAFLHQALERAGHAPGPGGAGTPAPLRCPVRAVGPDAARPHLIPYADDLSALRALPPPAPPGPADGAPLPLYELPAGRYVAFPAWPELARLHRPVAVPCAAPALPLAPGVPGAPAAAGPHGPGAEEALLLVVETRPGEVAPGSIALVREGEAVRPVLVQPGAPLSPEAVVGTVALVVRRHPDPDRPPAAPADDEADLDLID